MKLNVELDLETTLFEQDISDWIKEEIEREVRAEVKKQAKSVREAVAVAIKKNEKELIDRALKAVGP